MRRILIIDPDPTGLPAPHFDLNANCCEVLVAVSVKDATSVAAAGPLCLILTEWRVGDADAVSLIPQLRARSVSAPILVTTPVSSYQSVVAAMRAGATDFVAKPTCADDLRRLVERYTRGPEPGAAHVARAMNVIARDFHDERLSLASVAASLDISPEHLCRLIKRHTGNTFGWHLSETRVARAQQLLACTRLSVKEVAAQCGFASTTTLDRAFRRRYSYSPRVYRGLARDAGMS